MYHITIFKKHTIGVSFDDRRNGALIKAVKEQAPELNIVEETYGVCYDQDRNVYEFSIDEQTGYTRQRYYELKLGHISEIRIVLKTVAKAS